MSQNEEELQRRAESGHHADDIGSKAYQQVFQALRKEPDFGLPDSFADRLVKMVEAKQMERASSREFIWLIVGVVLLLIAFAVVVVMTDFKLNFGFLSGMSSYTGLFLFGCFFIGVLNWIDKRFIKQEKSRTA